MFKKNTRKRLLAGALATVMMLTMCPSSWALADNLVGDEDIPTTQPLVDESRSVADSTLVEADTTETPAVPTPSEPDAKLAEGQDPAPAPSDGGANGGTDSTESGNSTNSTIPEGSGNISQKNDVVSNSPESEIATTSIESDFATYALRKVKYFIIVPKLKKTPTSGASLDTENYLPNATTEGGSESGSDGGVWGSSTSSGYQGGGLTRAGFRMADRYYSPDDAYNGYTVLTGVDVEKYLNVPKDLGYFTASNWKNGSYNKDTNTTDIQSILGDKFDVNNIEIVWYTIKSQSDGYHVDGYVKGVPINVTYHSNYKENRIDIEEKDVKDPAIIMSGDEYTILSNEDANLDMCPPDYEFDGWYAKVDDQGVAKEVKYEVGTSYLLKTELDLYAKWSPKKYPYTIEHYKYNPDTKVYEIVKADTETGTAALNDTITAKSKGYTGYVLNPHAVDYLASGAVTKNADGTVPKLTLKLFYDPDTNGNGIPDSWEYRLTFKVVNGNWNNGTNANVIVYVPFKNADGTAIGNVVIPDGIPTAGEKPAAGYQAGSWKDPAPTVGKEITGDTTFTYTYVPVSKYPYAIEHYKYNPNTKKYEIVEADTEKNSAVAGTVITATPKNYDGYVLNPHAEGYLASGAVTKNADGTVPKLTLKLFYDPDTNGNGIPDSWEYRLTFKVVNGNWNNGTNANVIVYVPFKNADGTAIGNVVIPDGIPTAGEKPAAGYQAGSWKDPAPTVGKEITGDTTFTYTYVPVSKYPYAIEHYKYNPNTKKYEIVEADTEKNSAVAGTVITATPKNYDGYVLNPHAEGYLASGTVVKTEDGTVPALTLKLFYDPDANGNEIPDSWEYRLTFKVVNGSWNDGSSADIVVYVPFKDKKTGEAFEAKNVVVPVTRIPDVGEKPNSGYHAGAWDTSPYDNYKVQKDTVFTYTYAQNSSGGSSGGHHRRPTVTIPDDVPTGLNGDDHYAYIVGYPDKTVRPQNGITRAEVATIFFRLLTDETRDANSTKSNSYSDVAAGAWYNHAVSTLSAMGIVKGDSDGKFNPNAPITRAEFAAIAARFDDKANTTTADFSDIASHWAKNEISAASNNGWINGYPDGTFRPDNKITRAEAMTLVNRVLKRLPETEEDLHDDMIKWSDNSDVSQWFYLDVQEATNSHYYQTKENKFEKWTKLRDTRDWTELEK